MLLVLNFPCRGFYLKSRACAMHHERVYLTNNNDPLLPDTTIRNVLVIFVQRYLQM